jgi:hypothetical protein
MSHARAAVVIQAGFRGLIARRGAEVQRCRLDLRASLAEARAQPGVPHPDVIQCMLDLADSYLRAWDPFSAEQAYTVALESIEREYGVGDRRCRRPAQALARIFQDRGEEGMAEEVLQRMLVPARGPVSREELEYNSSSAFEPVAAVAFTLGAWLTAVDEE